MTLIVRGRESAGILVEGLTFCARLVVHFYSKIEAASLANYAYAWTFLSTRCIIILRGRT